MTKKLYQTPIVEMAQCSPMYSILSVSEPTAPTYQGAHGYAPKRKVF